VNVEGNGTGSGSGNGAETMAPNKYGSGTRIASIDAPVGEDHGAIAAASRTTMQTTAIRRRLRMRSVSDDQRFAERALESLVQIHLEPRW